MSTTEYWGQLEQHAVNLNGTMWQVFSALSLNFFYHLAGVSTSVFGFTTNFSDDTAKPISQITTHLTFSPLPFIFAFTSGTVGLSSSHLLFPGVPRHVFVLFFGPCFGHFSSLVQPAAPRRRVCVCGRCRCSSLCRPPPGFTRQKWSRLKTQRVAAT